MVGCILPYLVLVIPLALANPMSNNTKSDVTNARLWKFQTTVSENEISTFVQTKIKSYAEYCCTQYGNNLNYCKTIQIGYWVWIPDELTWADQSAINNYLENMFNPANQGNSDAGVLRKRKMCGLEVPTLPADQYDYFPYFAFPKFNPSPTPDIHVEAQLVPQMTACATAQYMSTPVQTQFFLYTYNSPCVKGTNACLGKMFKFAKDSIYDPKNSLTWNQNKNMHTLNVGFFKWFTFTDVTYNTMRTWFCKEELFYHQNTAVRGMDFYKKDTGYNKYNFNIGLSFLKFNEENGDESFEDGLGGTKC